MTPDSSYFVGKLEITQCADGRNWQTDADFGISTPDHGTVIVPAGFDTDLASIPRLFWNILPPFGKYTNAAAIHDFLYRTKPIICSRWDGYQITRKEADGVLLEGMKLANVCPWQQVVIYYGVRLFGWVAWRDDSRVATVKGSPI